MLGAGRLLGLSRVRELVLAMMLVTAGRQKHDGSAVQRILGRCRAHGWNNGHGQPGGIESGGLAPSRRVQGLVS